MIEHLCVRVWMRRAFALLLLTVQAGKVQLFPQNMYCRVVPVSTTGVSLESCWLMNHQQIVVLMYEFYWIGCCCWGFMTMHRVAHGIAFSKECIAGDLSAIDFDIPSFDRHSLFENNRG